jgi:hypothetical protein
MKFFKMIFVWPFILVTTVNLLMASDRVDFSGEWLLDLDAAQSTSIEPLLESLGIPWALRKFIQSMSITQIISQTKNSISIQIKTSKGTETLSLLLDGVRHDIVLKTFGKVEFRSFWENNGKVLVTIGKFQNGSGNKVEWTTRRRLEKNGHIMIMDHKISTEDGRKLTAKRVLRKK